MNELELKVRQWTIILVLLITAALCVSLAMDQFSPREDDFFRMPSLSGTPQPSITNTLANVHVSIVDPTVTQPAGSGSQPSPAPLANCTYTVYHWRAHPDIWLAENILIDRTSYTKSEAFTILTADNPDVTTYVLKQFFPAVLNILKGADSSSIESTIQEASTWLSLHPLGAAVPDADRATGMAIGQALEAFNNGLTGPGACPDQEPTPTSSPTATATPTPSATPTRFIIQPPPATSRPTVKPTEPHTDPTNPPPTEPQPTEPLPTTPAPTATQRPTIAPTATARPTDPPPTPRPTPTSPLPTVIVNPSNPEASGFHTRTTYYFPTFYFRGN